MGREEEAGVMALGVVWREQGSVPTDALVLCLGA